MGPPSPFGPVRPAHCRGADARHDTAQKSKDELGVVMAEPAAVVFGRLAGAKLPRHVPVLFETACVLGGSIAGCLRHGCLPITRRALIVAVAIGARAAARRAARS